MTSRIWKAGTAALMASTTAVAVAHHYPRAPTAARNALVDEVTHGIQRSCAQD